jgi:hypothetical protein
MNEEQSQLRILLQEDENLILELRDEVAFVQVAKEKRRAQLRNELYVYNEEDDHGERWTLC